MNQAISLVNPFTKTPLQKSANGLLDNLSTLFPYKGGAYRIVKDDNYTQNFGYQWNKFAAKQIDREKKNTQISFNRFFAVTQAFGLKPCQKPFPYVSRLIPKELCNIAAQKSG